MSDLLNKIKMKYSMFDVSKRYLSIVVKDNNITLKLSRFRKPIYINK